MRRGITLLVCGARLRRLLLVFRLNLLLAILLGLNLLLLGRRLSPGCSVAGRRSIAITGRRSIAITGRRSIAITGRRSIAITGRRSTAITGRRSTGIAGRWNIAVTGRRWCNIVRAHLDRLAAIADAAAGIVEAGRGGPVAAGTVTGLGVGWVHDIPWRPRGDDGAGDHGAADGTSGNACPPSPSAASPSPSASPPSPLGGGVRR